MYRVENKYHISLSDSIELRTRLNSIMRLDYYSSCQPSNQYTISSLYFDDNYNNLLHETESGIPNREKYRIRIYNNSFDTIKLEIKQKQYEYIAKRVTPIPYNSYIAFRQSDMTSITPTNDTEFDFYYKLKVNGFLPQTIVTYERVAYICNEGNVRITFDYNIRVSDQVELFGLPDIPYFYYDNSLCVLEVKYDNFLPHYIAQCLETNKLERVSNSKYIISRQICG